MQSSSVGSTPEAIEKVLVDNGYEVDKPEAAAAAEPVEPKRDDFKNDEEFELATEDFEAKQQEREEAEESAREAAEAAEAAKRPHLTRKQKAIEKATRDLRDENKKLADRLAALESGKKPEAVVVAEPAIKQPKREEFKSDAEFDDAMFDYRYKVRRAKEDSEAQQKNQRATLEQNYENYKSAVADFREKHDDWDEVVNQKIPIHESVYLTVHELENGPAVTYYLGKHLAFAQKLAEMSPLAAVVEVGRLADRLKTGAPNRGEADGAAPRKPKPRLPEPVKPVSTAATASSLTSTQAAKDRNFKAFKAAQRAGR
jgi:hypothetical protein